MKQNHEIRIPMTAEEINAVGKFWKEFSPDLKKTGFYRRVFLLGIMAVKKQVLRQNKGGIFHKILKD